MEQPHTLRDYGCLFLNVLIERGAAFIGFSNVVGRRRHDQFHAFVGQRMHESEIVLTSQDRGLVGLKTLNVE
jgi:hypothetical protein